MAFHVRRVVTGHDDAGRATFVSDGTPPATSEADNGTAVSDLLWIGGPPTDAAAGGDPSGQWVLEPPPGGYVWRLVRLPAPAPGTPEDGQWLRVPGDDESAPGMHATDTLDFMVVLDGQIVLGLDDGEYLLGAGDTVVQRATRHRWRVTGDRPCTWSVVMVRPFPGGPPPTHALSARPTAAPTGLAPRRLVTGSDRSGRSHLAVDGETPMVFVPPGSTGSVMVDLWQTGGPLARADQGGDPEGPWELDPLGDGVAFRLAQLAPGREPGGRGWHTTPSIDLVLITSGRIELALPDLPPVALVAGDVVVQRATEHRWQPLDDNPARMVAAMITVPV